MIRAAIITILFAFSLGAQTGDPRQAPWIRLSTPDFDLFTCAPEHQARDLLRSFEQIRGFFQKASPVPLADDFPVRVVAFAGADEFSFYSPSGSVVAYYTPGPRTDYIVMRDPSQQSYAFGIHEYMHLLIRHSGLRVPLWLNEGWADVYSTLRPVHDGVAVGDLIPDRVRALETSAWMDPDALTAVTSGSKLAGEGARIGIFYAESWALVHMLFLSPEYAANFPKFLSALNRGRPAAEAFQTAWGRSQQQVFGDLRNYMNQRKFTGRVFEAPLGKSDHAVEVAKVDSFDARLMLADLTVSLSRRSEAKREYEALAELRPGNMLVAEALGFAALAVKENDEARTNFEKAFAAGDSNPLMCLRLAMLETAARGPREEILAALERAVQSHPDYVEAQYQLGLLHMSQREYQPAIDTLMSIKKVTPDRATPVFAGLAYAYFENGDLDKARANALTAKQWTLDTRQLATEDRLLALIDARAKSPFAPHPGEKTERANGILKGVDCRNGAFRLVLSFGDKSITLDLPDARAIEFIHSGSDKELKLTCGLDTPTRMIVDYAPASVMKAGPAGVVRRIEF